MAKTGKGDLSPNLPPLPWIGLKRVTIYISSKTYFAYIAPANKLKKPIKRISHWSEIVRKKNREILRASKKHNSWKALSNVLTFGVDLLKASCFIYNIVFPVTSEITLCSKDFTCYSLLSLITCYPFFILLYEVKTKISFFRKLMVW